MIYSVRGTLIIKEAGLAVVECAGVGYGCRTTYNTLASLGNIGDEVILYTYLQVREDGTELFGFYDKDNLDERTLYDGHQIKILNLDEGGNVTFLVFGYMNRGRHEGQVGISVYCCGFCSPN